MLAALLLHVALWRTVQSGLATEPALPVNAAVLQVRSVSAPSMAAPTPDPEPPMPVVPAAARSPAIARRPPAVPKPQVPPPAETAAPVQAQPELLSVAAVAAASNPGPAASSANDSEAPRYRAELPPPFTMHYQLRRGILSGTGDLAWTTEGGRYQARLEGRVAGISVLTQTSEGRFGGAGILPERFTERRPRRGTQAANFQYDHGKITFSGPSVEHSLVTGVQDRLSWMIQLPAVLSAEPQHLGAGGQVSLFVVSSRGDAELWVFRYAGEEILNTGAGSIKTAKFTRQPRKAYDLQAEVWLDPARHHLPVQAKLTPVPNGESLELLLRGMETP